VVSQVEFRERPLDGVVGDDAGDQNHFAGASGAEGTGNGRLKLTFDLVRERDGSAEVARSGTTEADSVATIGAGVVGNARQKKAAASMQRTRDGELEWVCDRRVRRIVIRDGGD